MTNETNNKQRRDSTGGNAEVEDSNATAPVYMVFNATDGIPASPNWMTWTQAEAFARSFPKRFATQGYYATSRRNRISPEEVVLLILDKQSLTLDLAMERLGHRWAGLRLVVP